MRGSLHFLQTPRNDAFFREVRERVSDWEEIYTPVAGKTVGQQALRCMDCGTPFCHHGCPLGNRIPLWNERTYRGKWKEALDLLHQTNNFPEWTGRLCPAPCESQCLAGLPSRPVTIRSVELHVAERGWEEKWILPEPPVRETGRKVAIVGSGPAGLACAQQLRRAGHAVSVFEKNEQPGGILRYGIPDFKLKKEVIDRRLRQMQEEGVQFFPGVSVGKDLPIRELLHRFDAIVLAVGTGVPNDLPIPGRELRGIVQAMTYLEAANRFVAGRARKEDRALWARGRRVAVIGGGDTGADCVSTALRQGCRSVVQLEILPAPEQRPSSCHGWPQSHPLYQEKEGDQILYATQTKAFLGDGSGRVRGLKICQVEWDGAGSSRTFTEIPGTEQILECDLVILALGFKGPDFAFLGREVTLQSTARGRPVTDAYRQTSHPGIFVAGDAARGPSLIVWAIAEGRHTALGVDRYLMGTSELPSPFLDPQGRPDPVYLEGPRSLVRQRRA